MKKILSAVIVMALLIASVFSLVSCDESSDSIKREEVFVNSTVLKDDKAFSTSDWVTLRFELSNPGDLYTKASIVIYPEENCFAFEGYEGVNEIRMDFDDFDSAKYKKGITRDFKIKYTGPTVSEGCLIDGISYELHLETEDGTKRRYYGQDVLLVSLGEYVAFDDCSDVESWIDICKKLPGWETLSKDTENTLFMNPNIGCLERVSFIVLGVDIPTTKPLPVSESVNIDVGVAYGNSVPTSGDLRVEAEGFSIAGEDGVGCADKYSFSYDDVCYDNYGWERRREDPNEIIKLPSTIDHWESVTLTCGDIGERSGVIKISASSRAVKDVEPGDSHFTNLYYATDGKNIAYSVESEDAAKRALYGELGYFFKVSVPEYFDSLFDRR